MPGLLRFYHEFRVAWATPVLILVAASGVVSRSAPAGAAEAARPTRPEIVAVYYPHWHNYDHGSSWKGEGWTEWEGLKAAVPRFPGHHQPLKPSWGCFDESDPQCVAREIDLAADHGIDVFLYDWYWYSGVRTMEEALEHGFLKAGNRHRMKFALMWANHDRRDQFCPEFGKDRTVWLPSRHSAGDLRRVVDYGIEHYFREPNYWRPQGELFFSVFEAVRYVKELGGPEKTRAVLAAMDARLREAGLPPMHWNGMVSDAKAAELLKQAGFKSTSRYNVTNAQVEPDGTKRYEEVIESHRKHWRDMLAGPLVDLPIVTQGWDSTPRCRTGVPWPFPYAPKSGKYPFYEYPYTPVVTGNTPQQFERLLRVAADHAEHDPRRPFAVVINAWNEWTEGSYLLPEERYGTQYVEAIRRVFGQKLQAQPAKRQASSTKGNVLVGAIRWDAWYGDLPETARPPASVPYPGFDAARNRLVSQDPGKETRRSLAVETWRYRWPFFTTLGPDGMAQTFDENRTVVLEREIDDAVHGGLDYWAFTAYPETSPLSYTLKTFLTCKNCDKIRFSLFVPMWPAYGRIPDDAADRAYWAHLLRMVRQPNYLKVEGSRPVLFLGFFNDALAKKVLDGPWPGFVGALARCGFGKPYLVICEGSAKSAKRFSDMFHGDALSAYAVCSSKAKAVPFADLAAHAETFWQQCEQTGTPAAPICMTGWDRRTRVLNPVSWESFHLQKDSDQYYYQRGTPEELAAHIGRGVSWYQKHPGKSGAKLVLIYAWNEFDEGGWLAPALPPPHGEGTARLDALRKVLLSGTAR